MWKKAKRQLAPKAVKLCCKTSKKWNRQNNTEKLSFKKNNERV